MNTSVRGHLWLFVLKSLTSGEKIQCSIMDIHRVIGKIPFKQKKSVVLPKHRFTGPFNPLHLQLDSKDNPLPGNEPLMVYQCIMTSAIEITIHQLENVNVAVKC